MQIKGLGMTGAAAADEAVIFLHVPKAAGSTLNRLIECEYPLFEMYSIDPVFDRWSWAHLQRLSKKRLGKIRIFKGHMLFGLHAILPQPATYITVLREPVDRVLSAFLLHAQLQAAPVLLEVQTWRIGPSRILLDAHQERTSNVRFSPELSIAKPFTAEICEIAKENLLRYFSVVGLAERFEESLALMKLRFGWKLQRYSSFNVTRTRPRKGRCSSIDSRFDCREELL